VKLLDLLLGVEERPLHALDHLIGVILVSQELGRQVLGDDGLASTCRDWVWDGNSGHRAPLFAGMRHPKRPLR
jgi:hypothetical protein